MNAWILVSLILAIMVVVLFFRLNRKNIEVSLARQQEEREWTLKVALEKTFHLPTVEASELVKVEPQINQIMTSSGTDAEVEEQMRLAVMELYAQKAERAVKEEPPKESAAQKHPPIGGRGR